MNIYSSISDIDFNLNDIQDMPWPDTSLMVHPSAFDVIYSINPHMDANIGKVDKDKALNQWEFLKKSYHENGLDVQVIDGVENLPDMVFCANQSLPYLQEDGRKQVIMSNMRHPQRKDEVQFIKDWYQKNSFEIFELENDSLHLEGMGDAIWHLGKRMLWGGYGFRTEAEVYTQIAKTFNVPVLLLELQHPSLYHLDTCLSVLNKDTVLIYPGAFTEEGLKMINLFFENVIHTDEIETLEKLACNAVSPDGKTIIIEKECVKTAKTLEERGFEVVLADTSEYLKSGGSVFCMKMLLWNQSKQ